MDLSFLKWPVIAAIVVGFCWLLSSGGVNFMYKKLVSYAPGTSVAQDDANEASLSKLAGYSLATFQYDRAKFIYTETLKRFPEGKNKYWNTFQLARCEENLKNYQTCVNLLRKLIAADAATHDERVSTNEALQFRIGKLVEMYELK